MGRLLFMWSLHQALPSSDRIMGGGCGNKVHEQVFSFWRIRLDVVPTSTLQGMFCVRFIEPGTARTSSVVDINVSPTGLTRLGMLVGRFMSCLRCYGRARFTNILLHTVVTCAASAHTLPDGRRRTACCCWPNQTKADLFLPCFLDSARCKHI